MTHTIIDALNIAKKVEELIEPYGYHVAIGGSCMYQGYSDDDIDLICYTHHQHDPSIKKPQDVLPKLLDKLGLTQCEDLSTPYSDPRIVMFAKNKDGQRIDFIFV